MQSTSLSNAVRSWALADVVAALVTIQTNQEKLMTALDDLKASVAANTQATNNAVALLKNGATAEQLAEIKTEVDAGTKLLNDAIAAAAPPLP